jgi:uncharacterized coiled-coil protein SlyX
MTELWVKCKDCTELMDKKNKKNNGNQCQTCHNIARRKPKNNSVKSGSISNISDFLPTNDNSNKKLNCDNTQMSSITDRSNDINNIHIELSNKIDSRMNEIETRLINTLTSKKTSELSVISNDTQTTRIIDLEKELADYKLKIKDLEDKLTDKTLACDRCDKKIVYLMHELKQQEVVLINYSNLIVNQGTDIFDLNKDKLEGIKDKRIIKKSTPEPIIKKSVGYIPSVLKNKNINKYY